MKSCSAQCASHFVFATFHVHVFLEHFYQWQSNLWELKGMPRSAPGVPSAPPPPPPPGNAFHLRSGSSDWESASNHPGEVRKWLFN